MRFVLLIAATVLAAPSEAVAQAMPGMDMSDHAQSTDPGPNDHPAAAAPDLGDMGSMADMPGMDMPAEHMAPMHHGHGGGQLGGYPMTRDAGGTAWQPDSAHHDGLHEAVDGWMLMAHGEATLVYDNQGGPRGADKTFLQSHFVFDVGRPIWGGTLTLRSLFSLDPIMGNSGYPLLLQTGETADGRTRLIDRQHPHDFFGELGVVYSHPLADGLSGFVYLAPAGEPPLGPPSYLHRAAGMADPEAPIDHHWLDSTHLAYSVVTTGLVAGDWKIEGAGFRGREPDQHRYDIGAPAIDSWAVRLTWNPAPDWSLQVSHGRLHSVEQLEPAIDQDRTTASVIYNRPIEDGSWQTVFAWGRIDMNAPGAGTDRSLDAYLLESAVERGADTVFARLENVSKDEFFPEGDAQNGKVYNVSKLSVGYQRAFPVASHLGIDLGALVSKYRLPKALDHAYGADPTSFMLFLRMRLT